MIKIKPIARRLAGNDGAEIAEAALVLPLAFLLLLGIVWFGRAFNIYSTIQQAAQQGAIVAARASCATCLGGTTFPTADTVDNTIFNVIQASNLSPSQIKLPTNPPNCGTQPCLSCPSPPWPSPPSGGPCSSKASIYVCQNVQLNPTTQPLQCGSVVSFQYPFAFNLPLFPSSMQSVTLSAQAESRMED